MVRGLSAKGGGLVKGLILFDQILTAVTIIHQQFNFDGVFLSKTY